MNRLLRNLAAAALVVVLLGACGAKGPLFLPERPAPQEAADPAIESDAPAEEPAASEDASGDASETGVPPVTPPTDGASTTP